jgi:hypothetical protein
VSAVASLFPDFAPPRRERYAVPVAMPADLARKREVYVLFTSAAPKRGSLYRGADTPAQALDRILDVMGLAPSQVVVDARPETPDTVEIRDDRTLNQPRHILALVYGGMNIAEARSALTSLQPSKSKGGRR